MNVPGYAEFLGVKIPGKHRERSTEIRAAIELQSPLVHAMDASKLTLVQARLFMPHAHYAHSTLDTQQVATKLSEPMLLGQQLITDALQRLHADLAPRLLRGYDIEDWLKNREDMWQHFVHAIFATCSLRYAQQDQLHEAARVVKWGCLYRIATRAISTGFDQRDIGLQCALLSGIVDDVTDKFMNLKA